MMTLRVFTFLAFTLLALMGYSQAREVLYKSNEFSIEEYNYKYARIVTIDYDTFYLNNNMHRHRQVYGTELSGIYEEYIDNELRFSVFLCGGQFHGNFKSYHSGSDKVKLSGTYFNGKLIEYKFFDLEGKIVSVKKF